MPRLVLNENRFFDPEPSVRSIARELYEGIKGLPIVSPHGHTEPAWFGLNLPFSDPTELIIIPDHYVFRMLYSQRMSLESLGVPTLNGSPVEQDRKKIWQIFADNFYLFEGTPTGIWLNHELETVFGVKETLNSNTALNIYDEINKKLQTPEYLPRALFDQFNIELLSTTDPAESKLVHHKAVKESDWAGKVIPTFRPDGVTDLSRSDWQNNIKNLSDVTDININSYKSFIDALQKQRSYFKAMGAVATDHGVFSPYTHELPDTEADTIFERALKGKADARDAEFFTAHMLMEMVKMSVEDGLVMQIHPGSMRNHNGVIFEKFGFDKGCDIPVQVEFTNNLRELLNKYGNNSELTIIIFTLDEASYSRELAPLAGHYPALKLGPPWWFHDGIEGMKRFRERATETAGIYNTVGFNDDTRAFPSIPARHDVARRIDCNFLAGLVARHIIDIEAAQKMSRALTYDLVKKAYNLN